jgi:proprotein convertase subtilisin/kexin type 5
LLLCLSCNNITNSTDNSTLVYYLYIGNSVCSLECPLGQYIRTGYPNACQQCAVECVGCIGISTNCTQQDRCTLGYYFYRPTNSCIESCPEGYYASAATQFCEACAAGCSLCQDAGLLNCQSCKQDLSSNTSFFKEISHDWCVSECLPGEYAMESDLKCHSCDLTCVLCSGAATVCQQCRNVSGVNYFHYADACLKSCPNGYYGEPSNNTCVSCHPACALCFGPSTSQCSACRPDTTASPAVYYYLHYSTTICDLVCPYGQYAVNGSFTCDPCNMNCATCVTTSTFCLSCTYINSISIVYLFANKCIIACPSGTWHNSTQELNHECSTCHPYCIVCAGPSNEECSSCGNSSTNGSIYYLHINSTVCQETCPNGQYIALAVPNLCQSCSSTCVRCSSTPTYCQQCSFNYFLHAPTSTCSQTCPAGYFNDPIITVNYYVCSPCPTGCATCTGPSNDQCLTCNNASLPDGSIQSYFKEVIGTNCVAQCSTVGYYGNPVTNLC